MNFFERQDQARRKTRVLVAYFLIAVLLLVFAVNGAALFLSSTARLYKGTRAQWMGDPYWIYITLLTLLIVGGGSLFRLFQLRRGGRAVAEMVRARRITPSTMSPEERRLVNVAEEMSVASGIPVPELYVMDDESGINAFVAGYRPSETVLVVTRGTLQSLSRDELQGVIGHEYSHIFHGDMRLNVRLIGVLAGILVIGQLGLFLMRSLRHTRSSSGKRSGQGMLLALGAGTALFLIGYIGLFFGRLIKAAISRQREYLADASSVQYTRNPRGIAGALWKIKNHLTGSHLASSHAEEMSHMCFGTSQGFYLRNLLATHPPLEERIRVIDPHYRPEPKREGAEPEAPAVPESQAPLPEWTEALSQAPDQAIPFSPDQATKSVGNPTPGHLIYGAALHHGIPDHILQTLRSPERAIRVIYAILLSQDPENLEAGLQRLHKDEGKETAENVHDIFRSLHPLGRRTRLPLIDMSIPALRGLTQERIESFLKSVETLITGDQKITFFEFFVEILLRKQLNPEDAGPDKIKYRSFDPVLSEISLLLSIVAYAGGGSREKIETAYHRAMNRLTNKTLPQVPRKDCSRESLYRALKRLGKLSPFLKSPLIDACVDCVMDDRQIQVSEAELMRAISASLDCPMPPIII